MFLTGLWPLNNEPKLKKSNIMQNILSRLLFLALFFSLDMIAGNGTFSGRPDLHAGQLQSNESDRNPGKTVQIVALQAGTRHYKQGNPGNEANFAVFEQLAREAASSENKPDLICFPEYTISGWPYPPEAIINSLAEAIPGDGVWYTRYRKLALETGIALLGWLVEIADGNLYNTAFMIDGKGNYRGKYRKVQANLGEQTWWGWSQGEQFDLIELDGVISPQEQALAAALEARLAPEGKVAPDSEGALAMLALLARSGQESDADAAAAWQRGAEQLRSGGFPLPAVLPDFTRVNPTAGPAAAARAARLAAMDERYRRQLLEAMAAVAAHDGVIRGNELELLRTTAAALDCPMPPLAVPGS